VRRYAQALCYGRNPKPCTPNPQAGGGGARRPGGAEPQSRTSYPPKQQSRRPGRGGASPNGAQPLAAVYSLKLSRTYQGEGGGSRRPEEGGALEPSQNGEQFRALHPPVPQNREQPRGTCADDGAHGALPPSIAPGCNNLNGFTEKPRPESWRDCLTCAIPRGARSDDGPPPSAVKPIWHI